METTVRYCVPVTEAGKGESAIYRREFTKGDLCSKQFPEIDTMQKALLKTFKDKGDRQALGTLNTVSNEYEWINYKEVDETARSIGSALLNLNLVKEKVDTQGIKILPVGLYSKNRAEWTLVDVACQLYGLTSTAFYDTLGPASITYALTLTGCNVCFCQASTAENLIKAEYLGDLKTIVLFDELSPEGLTALTQKGLTHFRFHDFINEGRKNVQPLPHVKPETPLTLCFTSGTTGEPKGAVQTHENFVALISIWKFYPKISICHEDVHLSYLPLPHTFERCLNLTFLSFGAAIGFYSGNILNLKDDLARLRPTIFISVPRIYNRFYESIQQIFESLPEEQRQGVQKAVAGKLHLYHTTGATSHEQLDKTVFAKTKGILGGRVRFLVTGAAPISPQILDFLKVVFCAPILEGYGQTESMAASFLTDYDDNQSGYVGGCTSMNEIKLVDVPEMDYSSSDKDEKGNLAPRGEVCFRGPNIITGYFGQPDRTQEAIDQDGWLHSGDIGVILPNGALKIIDRKKNIFKLAQGEYVSPERIENSYQRAKGVLENFVYGHSLENYVVGIIVPEPNYLQKYATDNGIEGTLEELCQNLSIKKHYLGNVVAQGKHDSLAGFEQIKNVHLEPKSFGLVGLLTDTQKMQRFQARKHYERVLTALYAEGQLQ